MKRRLSLFVVLTCLMPAVMAFGQGRQQAPSVQVDPLWPKPLPNHWILGSVTGVTVDSRDHIWIVHQGAATMTVGTEMGTGTNPKTAENCCSAAPPVLEFDAAGTLVSSWGGPGEGYQWPRCPSGIGVDPKGNVWIGGNSAETAAGAAPRLCQFGPGGGAQIQTAPAAPRGQRGGGDTPAQPAAAEGQRGGGRGGQAAGGGRGGGGRGGGANLTGPVDAHVIRFAPDGKLIRQIGAPGKLEGVNSTTTLNRPVNFEFDAAANEVYIADSGNRRIVVLDAETGAHKRQWGAYGNKPDSADLGPYDPNAAPAQQFRFVSCVRIARDGLVYVCDRVNNRIQVFQKDGKFVREVVVSKTTLGGENGGAVWDIAFSKDPQQRFVYVANGYDKKVHILLRESLQNLTTFGTGGRMVGQFVGVGSIAVDSKGNVYTGETFQGKRVQKWNFRGLANVTVQNR